MHATIDEVLDILHRTGPDLVHGNSNHGPMTAEALFALGRPDAVLPWLEKYRNRFQDRPPTKFTEACLREYALNPKPVYLVAARDAAERVGPI